MQELLRYLHKYPSSVQAQQALFINYNSGPGHIPTNLLNSNDAGKNLAASLLFSSSCYTRGENEKFEQFCSQIQDPLVALKLIRRNLGMEENDMLLILVDELGRYDSHDKHMKERILAEAMNLMDVQKNVTFIFSALTRQNTQTWRGITGRALYEDAQLTLLDPESVQCALKTNLKNFEHEQNAIALLERTRIQGLIRQCYGHPRWVL